MSGIQVGDLVVVVRQPCCGAHIGEIYVVGWMGRAGFRMTPVCNDCGRKMPELQNEVFADKSLEPGYIGYPVSWLKRIPPLEELERVEEEALA